MKRNSILLTAVLALSLCLTGCTSAVSMIDNIVTFAEALIPLIPGVPANDAAAIANYADATLAVASDLSPAVTPAGISRAVADFRKLAIPQLSQSVPPKTAAVINGLSAAVSVFLSAYDGVTLSVSDVHSYGLSLVDPPKTKKLKLSAKDQKKLAEIQARIVAARAKLKAAKK